MSHGGGREGASAWGEGEGELVPRGPHLAVRVHEGDATSAEKHVHLAGAGGGGRVGQYCTPGIQAY